MPALFHRPTLRRTLRSLAVVLTALTVSSLSLRAQSGASRNFVLVRGRVLDGAGRPIEGVAVTAGMGDATHTDTAGFFSLTLPIGATTLIAAKKSGYDAAAKFAQIAEDSDVTTTFVLRNSGAKGASTGTAADPAGFEWRRAHNSGGVYITRDDIERAHASELSQVLRGIPFLNLTAIHGQRVTGGWTVSTCKSVTIVVDGMRADEGFDIDDILPASVRAIEVYRGPASAPSTLSSILGQCASILVWTRNGE